MNEDSKERNISTLLTDEKVWSWKNTKIDLQAMHMDPLYSISSTSGLQLRKTFNFNHAIDYLAATTSFGGETFIAVQSLSSKSIVHIWNTVQHKNCKVKLQYRINSFIIVNSLMIGVALCGDGKLRVYTSVPTLVEVAAFELVKPATYPVYNPFNKDILLGGISEVNVWCFREERKGEKKNPLSEVIRMNLERGQSFNPSLGDQWVTCITINEKSSQVVIAAETLVSIVDANTYIVKNLIRTDTCSTITQCTLYNAMDYTITGHQDGTVNIWSTATHQNFHRLKAHQAKLTGLEVHTGIGLLITISLDKTIKVIRLSSMEEVYNIMTGDRMTNLRVLDRNSLAYCTKYSVKVWNLYQVDSLVNRLFSEVYRMKRTGEGQMLVETEDGGLRLLNVKGGDIVTTIFSSTNTANFNLKYSAYSSSRNMTFILDPEAGHVEGYNCETHPAELKTLFKTEGQKVNAICEAYLGIPYWLPTAKRSKTRTETMLSLVLVGTAEGQLIVTDGPDWLHLPQPVNIERGMVKDMEASSAGEGSKKCTVAILTGDNPSYISVYILSISTDNNLSVNLRHVLTLTSPISLFLITDVYLMISFSKQVSLVKFPSILEKDSLHSTLMEPTTSICEPYVEIYKQSPSDSHTKSVTDMDALSTLEVFVTVAAEDYFMKLWDNKNVLLREILFSTPVYGVCFATDFGAIFCSNNTNLTVIPVSKYLPPQYIQRLLNLEGEFDGTVESLKAVPSSCTCDEPEEVPVSLNTRRKRR
ncbi:WD repeat-containing protein 87-like isoform X2 [Bolinopsis microptera]|uniref:WD repeat-containing protein 87-like isoform X2 n=1 Tax=Bolinopsis microptera TaxID=2820187 RepID=UPI003078BB22